MEEKKILLKEVYENLLSEAYTEKNDKLLPIAKYDDEVAEKIEKLITIDAQDYEVAIDSKDSKNYYDTYLRIFYGIIKCENEKDLGKWKTPIIENNPWKEALEKESNKYRSIADSDRSILEPLIDEEINNFKDNIFSKKMRESFSDEVSKIYSQYGGEKKFNTEIKESIAKPFFKQIFSDFEHAFDGNFENPRVIILGINPKLENIKHKRFNLQRVYRRPFDSRRYTLFCNNLRYDEYYFTPNGFFFIENKENNTPSEIRKELLYQIISKKEDTPYALWEFFPYATNSEIEWYDGVKISKKIKKYLELKKILPSQIWLLCLLTYTLKKAIFSSRKMYLFLTKTNKSFKDKFFEKYRKLLKINEKSNVKILTKNNSQNRKFHCNNIKEYNKKKMNFNSVEEFFEKIWGIPLLKMKRKRKRAKCRKVIRKRIVKSRKSLIEGDKLLWL